MSDSPERKKPKPAVFNDLKRFNDSDGSPSKRIKKEVKAEQETMEERIRAKKRNNFIIACRTVSREAYFDLQLRFHLTYIPSCLREDRCKHRDPKIKFAVMPSYAEESFKIELKTNMWWEALEVCLFSITPTQYLSAEVLKDVVEIMLNAHEDPDSTYSISDILIKCQQVLAQNFNAHPPCMLRRIRSCYNAFLNSPMDMKDKTFSNRSEFECRIFRYCLNRLEHEMDPERTDGPLIDKQQNVPEEMRQTVKGLHWQKEKFEIYEVLDRTERIQRLFLVLDSILQLLKADLAIWHNRHPTAQGKHMLRTSRPLLAQALWPQSALLAGAVGGAGRQLMRLFCWAVHYGYPECDVAVLAGWLNAMAQTFYLCETYSNHDYPNMGKYSKGFSNALHKVIKETVTQDCRHKVIEAIQPAFIRQDIAAEHIKDFLPTTQENILDTFANFLTNQQWKNFPTKTPVSISENLLKKRKVKHWSKSLTEKFTRILSKEVENEQECYPRKCAFKEMEIDVHCMIHAFYVAVEAYLETYRVEDVQSKLSDLNEHINLEEEVESQDLFPYGTTAEYIKIYRSIYNSLKEVIFAFRTVKQQDEFIDELKIFKRISILGA